MPIQMHQKSWILSTHNTAYSLGLNERDILVHTYWGKKLPLNTDYPVPTDSIGWASFTGGDHLLKEEYPAYASNKYIEPCLKATFADGVRDVVLKYDRAHIDGETLTIILKDAYYPIEIHLNYRVYPEYDLIERSVTIHNHGNIPVILERIFSAQWHVPSDENYRLNHLTGRWYDEFHLHRDKLTRGVTVLESRRITTSHHHSPWFALDQGNATETAGEVWFGTLAWSGNWKLVAEVTDYQQTRLSIGLNDWDFNWTIPAGNAFTTPASIGGYSAEGFGLASRNLHDYVRETVLPHGKTIHQILYNSWEATFFDVDEVSQIQLAEVASQMGIELFVLDDGWFHGRNDDFAGLGDWWCDEKKFPNGLTPLIERVNALGMDFGLWIEPEMVNANSDLYRANPDWVIHFPNRQRTEARNQMILNFGRKDVQAYIIEKIDALLSENKIAFIKWDMNRNVSEPGWQELGERQREIWVRYVQGLYHVWGTLRERHPNVIWQSCSGGGGRADYGILRFADQVWVSDNTEAPARLNIQEGYSQLFPAHTMEAWVTDSGDKFIPLKFKFHVSMCGSLGVGGHLLKWTESERKEAAQHIAKYKQIRHIIQFGDLYRLRSPQDEAYSAVQYLSKDGSEGVLFAFRTHLPTPSPIPRIYPQGLDADAQYRIETFDEVRTGSAWQQIGIQIPLRDFDSALLKITRV